MVTAADSLFLRWGEGRTRSVRTVALLVAAGVLTTAQVAAEPASAQPATVQKATPAVPHKSSAPDVVSASMTARAQGARVLVDGLTTVSDRTWANPDGTLTTESYQGAVRTQNEDGTWAAVDLALEAQGGEVEAKVHPLGLSVAGATKGADGQAKSSSATTMASVEEPYVLDKKGRRLVEAPKAQGVQFGWPSRLGTPQVKGGQARYAGVYDGVDLLLNSRRSGFEALLEFKDADAVAAWVEKGKAKPQWRMPIKLRGLTPKSKDGGVDFVNAAGDVVSQVAAPIAWDDEVDPRSGERVSTSPVTLTVENVRGSGRADLVFTPDVDWMTDPGRVFPLTIDPTYASASAATTFDTFVQTGYTTDQSKGTELKVGTYDGGTNRARSFLTFTNAFKGKQIKSASLSIHETWSASCTAKPLAVHSAAAASTATTWSNQPWMGTQRGSVTVAKGYSSSCPAGRVSVPMTELAQTWSSESASAVSVALRADESDSLAWKRFSSSETSNPPYVTYTYNRPPSKAAAPIVTGAATYQEPGSSTTQLFTSDTTPEFSTTATDPDGNNVKALFEVHSSTSATASTLKASCTTSSTGSGGSVTCTPGTALADGGTYHVRALSTDAAGLSNATWSPWTTFTLAAGKPAAPVISCPTPYSNGSWQSTAPGADVTCTITAAGSGTSTAGSIRYAVDGAASVSVKITPSADPAVAKTSVKVPKTEGGHRISATAVSRAGIGSPTSGYAFGYGAASLLTPSTRTATSGTINVAGMGQPNAGTGTVTAKLQWRIAGGDDTWTDGPALPVSTGDGGILTARGAWDTRTATTTRDGVDLPDRKPVTLNARVCFSYPNGLTKCTDEKVDASITRLPHAFGAGYPTAEAGPGQVGLYTGELAYTTDDVTVPGYAGELTIGRSHLSLGGDGTVTGWPTDPSTGVFGPGFTASLDGPDLGAAGATVVDSTSVDGTIALIDEEGEALVFGHPTGKRRTYALSDSTGTSATYAPATIETAEADTTLVLTGTGTGARLTLTDPDGTRTVYAPLTTPSTTAETSWVPVSVLEPGNGSAKTYYGRDTTGRITRIVSVPAGMSSTDCPTTGTSTQSGTRTAISGLARGCRALDINYATATTATSTSPGNVAGQVSSIQAVMWNGTTMAATTVATYSYDATKRLVAATDSRAGLTTRYTWQTSSTRLESITPAGLAPYRFAYATPSGSQPRLQQVTRDPATAGGTSVILASFVYDIDATRQTAGLPDVTQTVTDRWFQASTPSTGYAVFGPERPTSSISPGAVASQDWQYADLSYVDGDGYTVDSAEYGAGQWLVTATDYDQDGRVVRELAPEATSLVPADGSMGIEQVNSLSTQTDYDALGRVTDTWEPVREAAAGWNPRQPVRPHTRTTYDQGAPNSGINPATDKPYSLPTTITVSAAETVSTAKGSDLDTLSITQNGYDTVTGTTGNGWELGTPTSVTTKDPWGFAPKPDVTTITAYDADGQVVQNRQPKSNGTDAGTRVSSYYTAGAHSNVAACGNRPEWAGSLCRTAAAGTPSSGPALPTVTTTYDTWLNPTSVTESAGSATRTTTTTYDTAGRETSTKTTSTIPSSTARPGTFTSYNSNNGLVAYTGELIAGPAAHATKRTTYTYDQWGQQTKTTTDLGDSKTTAYDPSGRVTSETSTPASGSTLPVQTTTYAYDGTDANGALERRGLITKQSITRAGSGGTLVWSAGYGRDGEITRQDLPGKIVFREERDLAGVSTQRSYSGQVTPVTESTNSTTGETTWTPGTPQQDQPWVTWSMYSDALERTTNEFNGAGSAFEGTPGVTNPTDAGAPATGRALAADKVFNYDYVGRLTRVTDRTATTTGITASPEDWYSDALPCTERVYGFDLNSNRTSLTTSTNSNGDCAGGGNKVVTGYDYDSADRAIHAGGSNGSPGTGSYGYDAFGRQTTLPAADAPLPAWGDHTMTYYDSDLPRSISFASGHTASYGLDSSDRRQTLTTTLPGGGAGWKIVNHYTDDTDNPDWTSYTEGANPAVDTRTVTDITDQLGATIGSDGTTTLAVINPHGDQATTITVAPEQSTTTSATAVGAWADYTEYGIAKDLPSFASTAGHNGYGWHGGARRSTTATASAGLTLMGVRWYNPTRGLFTGPDPVYGGNLNSYTHPVDPINQTDTTGEWGSWKRWGKAAGRWAWRNKWTIASTAAIFVPGVGWAATAYRAGRLIHAVNRGRQGYRATRVVSRYAGRKWTGRGRTSFRTNAGNVGYRSSSGHRTWRPPEWKNSRKYNGYHSNFTRNRGRHRNVHIRHGRRW